MATIVIADDHTVVRAGLRALLVPESDLCIVGEAADGLQALDLVRRLQCDLLIVDLMMPGLNGIDVAREVSRRWPQTRVIVLSMYALESYVLEALRAGVAGYVLKDSTARELVHAIREVLVGRRYVSPPFSERALELYMERTRDSALDPYDTLTSREREVLHLAAEGHTNAQIAERFVISPRTVEVHRANVMRKLGLFSQGDLIRYALKRGILPP